MTVDIKTLVRAVLKLVEKGATKVQVYSSEGGHISLILRSEEPQVTVRFFRDPTVAPEITSVSTESVERKIVSEGV
jgi:hypothetical protein